MSPKQWRRPLASLVAAVAICFSLLIFLGLSALWIRSYTENDGLVIPLPSEGVLGIDSYCGLLEIGHANAAHRPAGLLLYHWPAGSGGWSGLVPSGNLRPGTWDHCVWNVERSWFYSEFIYGFAPVSIDDHESSIWQSASPVRYWFLNVPIWCAAIATMLPCALWVSAMLQRQLARRMRPRRGLCPICRYDVRGIVELCPECGHPVPAAALE